MASFALSPEDDRPRSPPVLNQNKRRALTLKRQREAIDEVRKRPDDRILSCVHLSSSFQQLEHVARVEGMPMFCISSTHVLPRH